MPNGPISGFPSLATPDPLLTLVYVADMTQTNIALRSKNMTLTAAAPILRPLLGTGSPSSTTFLRGDGTWSVPSGAPAGSTTQVQFNSSGAFGASAGLTWSGTALTATSLQATPVGSVTASTGAFTTLNSTGANTFAALSTAGVVTNAASGLLSTNTQSATLMGFLGSGAASSTTFLRGDATWQTLSTAAGGATTQVQYNLTGSLSGNSGFTTDTSGNVTVLSLRTTNNIGIGTAPSGSTGIVSLASLVSATNVEVALEGTLSTNSNGTTQYGVLLQETVANGVHSTVGYNGVYINTPTVTGNALTSGYMLNVQAPASGMSGALSVVSGNVNLGTGTTTVSSTTGASSSVSGSLMIGAGTAATNVGIGGGNGYFAPTATSGSAGLVACAQLQLGGSQTSLPNGTISINASNGLSVVGSNLSGTYDLTLTGNAGSVVFGIFHASTNVLFGGKITTYNGLATAGIGLTPVVSEPRSTGLIAATSLTAYTVPAVDSSFEVSFNANVTTYSSGTFTVTCTYTDESNTSRVATLIGCALSGAAGSTIAAAGPVAGIATHIRCKASTTITFATVGTFTSLTYNVEGVIAQLA